MLGRTAPDDAVLSSILGCWYGIYCNSTGDMKVENTLEEELSPGSELRELARTGNG